MRPRLKNVVFTAALCLIPAAGSFACGPWFQPHYENGKSPYWTVLHETAAVRRLIANLSDLIPVVPEIKEGISTNGAIRQDFSEAVNRYLPKLPQVEKQKLIDHYLQFVMNERMRKYQSSEKFPELPEELAEFRLYREGVKELKPYRTEIPYSWQKLLELPRESRHYRTVWVYFMLGNYFQYYDCSKYYAACRAAAREGFADTPGLVMASYKNEIRFTKDPVRKIRLALEFMRNSPGIVIPLNDMVKVSESECAAMLADPLCREILAIFGCKRKTFEREVWKYKFRNADIMAWRAYDEGKVETAEKYLKLRVRDTLLSTYIEAKIARYHGDNELAIRKLRQWLEFVSKIDPNDRADLIGLKHVYDPNDSEPTYPLHQDVYGLLGSALVYRRDFTEAAMWFYRAGQVEADVTYIAENLMSLKELAAFADSVSNESESQNWNSRMNAEKIRHMTARRAFREGKFDIARKYMPDNYKGVLSQYLAFIRASKDRSISRDTRALCLYNAAKIMRWQGMKLCGTEGAPDDVSHDGGFGITAEFEDCPNCKYDPALDTWSTLCPKHFQDYDQRIRREKDLSGTTVWLPGDYCIEPFPVTIKGKFTKYITAPQNQRFHYRYRAAELAGQAAGMAQDEDLRALANLLGGECLRHRTPRKANVFYRRLIKESPNNAVAKIADKIRWFPVCPTLRYELRTSAPCISVSYAKAVLEQAHGELQEQLKIREEQKKKKEKKK